MVFSPKAFFGFWQIDFHPSWLLAQQLAMKLGGKLKSSSIFM